MIVATLGCDRLVVDLRPEDFATLRTAFSKGRGPVSVGNVDRTNRVIFKFAYETVLAVQKAVTVRPEPKAPQDSELVFLKRCASPWYKDSNSSPLSAEFRKLTTSVGLYRRGVSFYGLRRTFETVAGGTRDQVAVDYARGHADQSMAAVYRQRIDDERLERVADHVCDWLFAGEGQS